ncbi:riboflavin synthase [Nocardioides yefusunii]|uniref:Riboflavin synthase n=1 Tax=Nocardioides yefusunii TaxID=2500546 RepID=A0ABW1QZ79_9ACTN|nr:riboflavin synthase [Nocardioides yefusunii]
MFTGIIEELGAVHAVHELTDAVRLTVRSTELLDGVKLGDSIAVNGCCLTVAATGSSEPDGPIDLWVADVMAESLARTTLAGLRAGDAVNLERAVAADTRLGGHVVQGHVDGIGTVVDRRPSQNWEIVEFTVPDALAPLLVEKGSITIDGTSLTVVDLTLHEDGTTTFTVSLIPETLARTTLGTRAVGEQVNLESDVLARHVARIVEHQVAAQVEARLDAAVAQALVAAGVLA